MHAKPHVSATGIRAVDHRKSSQLDSALAPYDYAFPPELIASAPASPRDSARLLISRRGHSEPAWDTFANIGDYLPEGCLLVLNRTKVIPARLTLKRATGGKVDVLYLADRDNSILVMSNRKLQLGEQLMIGNGSHFTVQGAEDKYWLLKPSFPMDDVRQTLEDFGSTPIPPYIKHCPLSERELRREYQTVFAQEDGSVAAPTASLHFTDALLKNLQTSGIHIAYTTLHVNLGTFAPLTEDQLASGHLHHEHYHIDRPTVELLHAAKKNRKPIIAVGTTVVRTLESATDASGRIINPTGSTDLFIRDGYQFHFVDGMITNFHVPRSSLLMLVCAFAGRERILDLYHQAIEKQCRLFSFGDAMLLL